MRILHAGQFLVTAKALLDQNPSPTRDQIREALSGNLCRCTGYLQIFEAVEAAMLKIARKQEDGSAAVAQAAECREVFRERSTCRDREGSPNATSEKSRRERRGIARHRRSAPPRGRACESDGANALRRRHLSCRAWRYCKLLRSPHPHARIRKIDTSRALAHPGVYLVLTGKDLPIEYGIMPVSQDEQALCVDHVRHVGDPVAAVIAREELTAFEALDLIDVEYEILPTISDPEEALADSGAAHSRLRRRRQHSQARVARNLAMWNKASRRPMKFSKMFFSIRATRICPSSSTLRSR